MTLRSGSVDTWADADVLSPRPSEELVRHHLARFLDGLDEPSLIRLGDEVTWIAPPPDTVLMRQGEPGDSLWFVVSGQVGIDEQGPDGTVQRVAVAGPGESLGELALLSSEPRSATATTIGEVELLRLTQSAFEQLLAEHPATMAGLTKVVVERLNRRLRARAVSTELRTMAMATRAECEEVVDTANLVLRNLRITQMYHRLSIELTSLLGPDNTNWCTFACNASKTAGYSIRGEELPLQTLLDAARRNPRVERAIERVGGSLAATRIGALVDESLAAVSRHVSDGNLMVFDELAPIFAEFTSTFRDDPEPDPARLASFLAPLDPAPTEAGGQATLREALSAYHEAAYEIDAKRKAELILLGNLLVGLHEQIRLQPHIEGAMGAPLEVGLTALFEVRLSSRFDRQTQAVIEWLTVRWRRRLTRNLMTLRLPYGALRLGVNLPDVPRHGQYPVLLASLEDERLLAFAERYDRDLTTTAGSRAADWASLDDRMAFVLELFRSRQASLELFDQPFLRSQRADIARGQLPAGRL